MGDSLVGDSLSSSGSLGAANPVCNNLASTFSVRPRTRRPTRNAAPEASRAIKTMPASSGPPDIAALGTLTVSASGWATGDVRAVSFADHTVRQYVQAQARAEGFFEAPLDQGS